MIAKTSVPHARHTTLLLLLSLSGILSLINAPGSFFAAARLRALGTGDATMLPSAPQMTPKMGGDATMLPSAPQMGGDATMLPEKNNAAANDSDSSNEAANSGNESVDEGSCKKKQTGSDEGSCKKKHKKEESELAPYRQSHLNSVAQARAVSSDGSVEPSFDTHLTVFKHITVNLKKCRLDWNANGFLTNVSGTSALQRGDQILRVFEGKVAEGVGSAVGGYNLDASKHYTFQVNMNAHIEDITTNPALFKLARESAFLLHRLRKLREVVFEMQQPVNQEKQRQGSRRTGRITSSFRFYEINPLHRAFAAESEEIVGRLLEIFKGQHGAELLQKVPGLPSLLLSELTGDALKPAISGAEDTDYDKLLPDFLTGGHVEPSTDSDDYSIEEEANAGSVCSMADVVSKSVIAQQRKEAGTRLAGQMARDFGSFEEQVSARADAPENFRRGWFHTLLKIPDLNEHLDEAEKHAARADPVSRTDNCMCRGFSFQQKVMRKNAQHADVAHQARRESLSGKHGELVDLVLLAGSFRGNERGIVAGVANMARENPRDAIDPMSFAPVNGVIDTLENIHEIGNRMVWLGRGKFITRIELRKEKGHEGSLHGSDRQFWKVGQRVFKFRSGENSRRRDKNEGEDTTPPSVLHGTISSVTETTAKDWRGEALVTWDGEKDPRDQSQPLVTREHFDGSRGWTDDVMDIGHLPEGSHEPDEKGMLLVDWLRVGGFNDASYLDHAAWMQLSEKNTFESWRADRLPLVATDRLVKKHDHFAIVRDRTMRAVAPGDRVSAGGSLWGYELPNGKYTSAHGTVTEVIEASADVDGGDRSERGRTIEAMRASLRGDRSERASDSIFSFPEARENAFCDEVLRLGFHPATPQGLPKVRVEWDAKADASEEAEAVFTDSTRLWGLEDLRQLGTWSHTDELHMSFYFDDLNAKRAAVEERLSRQPQGSFEQIASIEKRNDEEMELLQRLEREQAFNDLWQETLRGLSCRGLTGADELWQAGK